MDIFKAKPTYRPETNTDPDKDRYRVKGGTENIYITGKCRWARTYAPDTTYNKWSITVWPADTIELNKIQKLKAEGIRNELKKDDDGYYMTFSRPIVIETRDGRKIPLQAPKVINAENTVITDLIGDGSDVTIKLDIYGGPQRDGRGKYKAARLDSVRVNNLVPFTKKELPEREQWQIDGLDEQPTQLF